MPLPFPLAFLLLPMLTAAASFAAVDAPVDPAPLPDPYAEVTIEPVGTSIYLGTVKLKMPPFERHGDRYESTYKARVIPLFFYNEQGTLHIELTEADLGQLEAGQRVEFAGRAENTDGEHRRIAGHADPTDARSGKIKVRVFVTEKIQLIFNTTYRFSAG